MAATVDKDEMEMTPEERKATYRQNEPDILSGILEAAGFRDDDEDIAEIEIIRNKKVVLKFRIHPLSEEEYLKARRDNTVYKRSKSTGTRVADHVNVSEYRSQLIYDATVEKDRERIWDNRNAWEKLAVLNGRDLVDAVLKAGEKDAIIDKLDEISGYQISMEETAKN